jgi:hypothetical protein
MRFQLFEEFSKKSPKKKKRDAPKSGEIENYDPPEYAVQPAKDDKGFFMFKKAFDSMKKRYETGWFST